MHVGLSVVFQGLEPGRSDHQVWHDNLRFADQAEPRGFDSVWTAEHHFTDYIMSPHPVQFLTYMAGRTHRVRLGSMVMVIPWHDPVRLAEEIAVLDTISHGRAVIGFGRGLGPLEFDGFRLEMGESRQRFVEYAQAITDGLRTGTIEFDGELYQQPAVDIRPRPAFSFAGRAYASAVSPESARIMARLGYGLLINAQKPWATTAAEVTAYRELYAEVNDADAPRPIIANFTAIHEDAERAREIQETYGIAYAQSAVDHYDFTNPRIETVNGYEYYAALRKSIEQRGIDTFVRFLAELQISGTPDEVLEQTIERARQVDAGAILNCFNFGGMPSAVAQESLDLYARQVLPRLKAFDPGRDIGSAQAVALAGD